MVQHREELIAENIQRRNKLTAICDELFPEFTQICTDPNLPSALALRQAFPTPAAIATASLSALKAARRGMFPSEEKLGALHRLAAQSIGANDVARVRGLAFEQAQLIVELQLLQQHLDALDAEIVQVISHSREGRIVTSIPGIGPTQAATILAMIGNIANFDRPAQLKASCGWAPTLTQSGVTLDRARLTPRGARSLKRTLSLAVWHLVRHPDKEFARLYARLYTRLVPRKCVYDERTRQYRGKGKVIGRIAGQLITVLFTLLKRDQERVAHAKGRLAPAPELYDPELHRRHRAGQYQPPAPEKLGTVVQLPPQ